ncbi:MAG TPA: AAA family ATPase [Egibacteraceae bacterium]|nr:AAA family ATPase [Egibacteraceae bacterium]
MQVTDDPTAGQNGGMLPVVPCPVLVGRAAEVDALAAALESACAGRGGLVFVVGEAGIGKSRLVHEIVSMATSRGVLVLRGRAVPGSSATAFRPLTEALAAVVPEAVSAGGDLEMWLPVLAAVVPTVGSAGAPVEASAPVRGEAVLRLLRSVAQPRGGLLVLEDLHWADPETIAVVEHLSDHLGRAPVLCVSTVRSDEHSPARDLVRRVAARRTAPVVELGRLNDAQVAAMVYGCTGGVGAGEVDRVVGLADGVPFLVEEMLVTSGLPPSFADAVQARLLLLPEADRRLLVTAAAFGRNFDWRLLGAATGLPEAEVVEALERGVAAQLVAVDGDGFRFRHALTAEAVFHSAVPPRRASAASAVLAALDAAGGQQGGEHRDVAARLAERAGHTERAGRLYLASGEDALERGALQTAVVGLDRAAKLLPAGEARDLARERLVDALALAGRFDDAVVIGQDLVARLPAARAAAVHLRLAGAATTAARWEGATEQLAAARPLLANGGSPALQAEFALREGELAIGVGDGARAEEQARAALDLARRATLPEVECGALQLLGRCARRSSLQRAEAWFREALAAAEAHGLALRRLQALHEIGTIGLLDRSDVRVLAEAQALAESLGAMATAAILDIELAAGYDALHDLDGERRHGLEAVRRGTELGLDLVVAYGWEHVAGAAALIGDPEQRETAAAAARAAAPGNRDIDGLLVGACDLVAALLANDTGQALAAAERCTTLLRGSETAPPAAFRAAWPLLLAVHHRPEATAAVAEMEQAGVAVSRAGRGCLTMAQAVIAGWSEHDRAAALAFEADQQLANVPLWRCVARRLAAEAAAADGWTIPDGWLTDAEGWFRRHGYKPPADACRALRRRYPATMPPAWNRLGVTRREADVLALVIEGCSNREIADQLYLSVRTVEKHVESLLRKTETKTRTQLARVTAAT